MGTKEFIIFAFAFGIIGVCQAQYYGRMRGLNSIHKDACTCTCEDLASLIALARILEDKELTYQYPTQPLSPPPPPPPPTTTTTTTNPIPCLSNFEELIMKLVNALVYTATETTKNSCHCPRSTSGPTTPNSNSYYSNSDEGLINVDLLNPNKNNNVLDLDAANQNVVGVGLGGNNYNGVPPTGQKPPGPKPTGQNPTGQNPRGQQPTGGKYQPTSNTNSDEGLINLDLLNPNKDNNVLDLDIGKQDVLGVGLGGNGGGGAVPNANNTGYTNNPTNAGEGLINVDLLNPNKDNNVLDLDVGKQTLLGVGLGN